MGCNCNDPGVSEVNTGESCAETNNCSPMTATPAILAGACACGCNPCRCEVPRGTGTTPFYNQAATCQESHTRVLNQYTFSTTVEVATPFNMPACNTQVTAYLSGVLKLQVGAYLWNATYGYLKVVAYDFTTFQATLQNDCQLSNASPGTQIPACTQFNVVDPPYEPVTGDCGGDGIFLTANFVAPAFGSSVTIQVSGTEGLTLNHDVQVGVGVYSLTAILTPYSITIRNSGGLGIVPGTTIYAKDALGNCITPITPYILDACGETPINEGSLVVCYLGAQSTLNATAVGQVPVVTDPTDNLVEFQRPDFPLRDCTVLTSCLNLFSGTDTYIAFVADSSIFYVGQIVVIQDPNVDTLLWKVTDIPDGVRIEIEAVVANTYTGTVADGIEVCAAYCCDQLDYELNHLGEIICGQDWSAAAANTYDLSFEAPEGATVSEGNTFTSTARTVEFSNTTCNQMVVLIHVEYLIKGVFDTNEGSWAKCAHLPQIAHTTAAVPGVPAAPAVATIVSLTQERVFGIGPGAACDKFNSYQCMQYHHTEIIALPANTNLRVDARQELDYTDYKAGSEACCPCANLLAEGSGDFTLESTIFMHAIGVAMQT